MTIPTLQHEIKKRRPFESRAEEAYLNLMRSAAVLAGPFERLFRTHGLSEATYNVLRILRGEMTGGNEAGLPCQEIAGRMIALVPDMTRLLDRLEHAGFVERERSIDDRRVVFSRITSKGLKSLESLDVPTATLLAEQFKHMQPAELRELSRLLEKARQAQST